MLLHTEKGISESTNASVLHHFHLKHGDIIRSEVVVTNQALLSTSSSSNKFTVDLTEPIMLDLVDGLDIKNDMKYTVCINAMEFVDIISNEHG